METHALIFIPNRINGTSMNLISFNECVYAGPGTVISDESFRHGQPIETDTITYSTKLKAPEFTQVEQPYWVLMNRLPLPKKSLTKYNVQRIYTAPRTLEAAVLAFFNCKFDFSLYGIEVCPEEMLCEDHSIIFCVGDFGNLYPSLADEFSRQPEEWSIISPPWGGVYNPPPGIGAAVRL